MAFLTQVSVMLAMASAAAHSPADEAAILLFPLKEWSCCVCSLNASSERLKDPAAQNVWTVIAPWKLEQQTRRNAHQRSRIKKIDEWINEWRDGWRNDWFCQGNCLGVDQTTFGTLSRWGHQHITQLFVLSRHFPVWKKNKQRILMSFANLFFRGKMWDDYVYRPLLNYHHYVTLFKIVYKCCLTLQRERECVSCLLQLTFKFSPSTFSCR